MPLVRGRAPTSRAKLTPLEGLVRRRRSDDARQQREGAVVELHATPSSAPSAGVISSSCRIDRLIGTEQRTAGDAEQQAVADLAGGSGDGDADGLGGHRRGSFGGTGNAVGHPSQGPEPGPMPPGSGRCGRLHQGQATGAGRPDVQEREPSRSSIDGSRPMRDNAAEHGEQPRSPQQVLGGRGLGPGVQQARCSSIERGRRRAAWRRGSPGRPGARGGRRRRARSTRRSTATVPVPVEAPPDPGPSDRVHAPTCPQAVADRHLSSPQLDVVLAEPSRAGRCGAGGAPSPRSSPPPAPTPRRSDSRGVLGPMLVVLEPGCDRSAASTAAWCPTSCS